MSYQRFSDLIHDLCRQMAIPDPEQVLQTGMLEVEGFDVMLDHLEQDPEAAYLNFCYGIVTSGRSLKVYRLLLEANLVIYAQDQAQLGMEEDTGSVVMIVRVPFGADVDGAWLVDLLAHYAQHGRYWRDNIFQTNDQMYDNIADGSYLWIRA
ncbi:MULTISPECIES: molecular chaperone Tir [unclassified Duganella]|uniref:molecular chaperone Tir n=1 Tax=unclassified Duganella TaxID=2636909 RepID=UPI000E34E6EA|nr:MULTISPECIES: molecular chaperone Tir [unclassified Duganella]RFP09356.1 molecular chaperone Tir [Duganella sp. BJB475]RFP25392.1 molecular chaperone Tir [Duganella sp. BJB476]